jgi:hypothetical protein
MAQVYMTAPEQAVTGEIAAEFIGEGIPEDRIHIYSTRPNGDAPLPVALTRYRSPTDSILLGGGVSALIGALLGLPLLGLGGFGVAPLLVLMIAAGAAGAVLRLWIRKGPAGELYQLEDALNRGETVMVLEVDDGRVGEVERKVKIRHPEVSVLGTDPQGTPPFP